MMRWTDRHLGSRGYLAGDAILARSRILRGDLQLETHPVFQVAPLTDLARRRLLADRGRKVWDVRSRGLDECLGLVMTTVLFPGLIEDGPEPPTLFDMPPVDRPQGRRRERLLLVVSEYPELVVAKTWMWRTLAMTTRRVAIEKNRSPPAGFRMLAQLLTTSLPMPETAIPDEDAEALAGMADFI